MDVRLEAQRYLAAGWAVVPIVAGQKRAAGKWQKTTYGAADFKSTDNIALKCGEPSGDRTDIDCDALEAVEAAKHLLPPTDLIHGRPGKPDSHYWVVSPGAKSQQFMDVPDAQGVSNCLIEIRSTGGYTLAPPSVHPSGDILAWSIDKAPSHIKEDELFAAVRYVAMAALLVRHWPGPGARHHFVGHLTGFLISARIPDFMITEIVRVAAMVAKDPDVHDRVSYCQGTIAKAAAGGAVTGAPKLAEAIGDDVVARLRQWFKLSDEEALESLNKIHFGVVMGKDYVIGREDLPTGVLFQHPKALRDEYANKFCVTLSKKGETQYKPAFDEWLSSKGRRSYRQVVFNPPPLSAAEEDYNLWRGFAVEPDHTKDCSLFLKHMCEVICSDDPDHFAYLLNLVALTIQEPGTPTGIATVMRGIEGCGKGVFARTIGDLFGRKHYAHLDKVDQLAGKFNAGLSGKIIVFADEAFFAGDKREIGALKRLITEPTLAIERKGIDISYESNHVHLFMATNEKWSWPASLEDRRGFLLKVSPHRKHDRVYWDALYAEISNGGKEGLLAYLLEYEVNRALIVNPPITKEKQQQQQLSLEPHLAWWLDCLHLETIGNAPWPKEMTTAALYLSYTTYCSTMRRRPMTNAQFGIEMWNFFSAVKSKVIKRERGYAMRSLKDARHFWDSEIKTGEEWPNDGVSAGPPADLPY